jgi:anti-sigma regulatory factor (Ser/Thr protein kinase)
MHPKKTRFYRFSARPSRIGAYAERILGDLPPALFESELELCLCEALSNAIVHGALRLPAHQTELEDLMAYLGRLEEAEARLVEPPTVLVRVIAEHDAVEITVLDPGEGFDWRPRLHADGRRGIGILERCTTEVRWNERGNCLWMRYER